MTVADQYIISNSWYYNLVFPMKKRVLHFNILQYQYITEAAAITLSETSSLIADQLFTCILKADAHYPA